MGTGKDAGKKGPLGKPKKGARTMLGLPKSELGPELAAKMEEARKRTEEDASDSGSGERVNPMKAGPHSRRALFKKPSKRPPATPTKVSESDRAPVSAPLTGRADPKAWPKDKVKSYAEREEPKGESKAEIITAMPVLDITAAKDADPIEDVASEPPAPMSSPDDDIDVDVKPPDSASASPVAKLFPDDLGTKDEPLLPASMLDDELEKPADWIDPGKTEQPRVADDPPESKDAEGISTGWLFGAALAIGIGVGVAYFATQQTTETVAPAATQKATAAETTDEDDAVPEPPPKVDPAPAATASAAPSAAPSASASATASASAAPEASAKKPPPPFRPRPRPRPGGNLEDIYE